MCKIAFCSIWSFSRLSEFLLGKMAFHAFANLMHLN
ncbi:unnamed protein product [Acanthoscelides obtectus]|uniref:Uncharacterized protein n=1 Tax=Acanthoscelides obtectus TaxID=200917 RepID=A0A9P0PA23_ACAOB|nr:unnamed protein product [Acanthoscelides obtectus]CAK1647142.1 hypothetical protein AOBTE_LOCUS15073 [Acanthoscelides obtectus]